MRTCSIEGCDKRHLAGGLCPMHYQRVRRHGDPAIVVQREYPHHDYGTRLNAIWRGMRSRCNDVTNPHYGGRGITVCDEWSTYVPFKVWAEANGYAETLVIDRIDSDKGYSPANCRWITSSENARLANAKRWAR